MAFTLAVIIISFLVGFAMKRGGLCTYAAVLQLVQQKKLERMMVFWGAAAWATLIVLPLAWSLPNTISLAHTHHHLLIAIVGGSILGVGAFLNKGCFFGTFVQLVSGNLNYLATLLGLATGIVITYLYLNPYIPVPSSISEVNKPNTTAYLWLLGMGVFALFMVFSIKLSGHSLVKKMAGLCSLSWQSSLSMLIIGTGGGLLYATVSGWNYADVLANSITPLIKPNVTGPSSIALTSTVAMVSGGIIAAVTVKEFAIKAAHFLVMISCFMGGMLMGIASLLTPGGNDGMILKGIPSLAPHAMIGYLMMVLVMLLLVYVFRRDAEGC